MLSVSDLVSLGFLRSHARSLLQNNYFVLLVKNKSRKEFGSKLSKIIKVYGISRARVAKAVFAHPRFADYDHARVVRDVFAAYRPENYFDLPLRARLSVFKEIKPKIVKAVFSFPQFAGYDHARVLRQAVRIGKTFGFDRSKISELLLAHPRMAGYSQRRNLAAVDAFRNAAKRTGVKLSLKEAMQMYSNMHVNSPYPVKGSKERETRWKRKEMPVTSELGLKIGKRLQRRKPK